MSHPTLNTAFEYEHLSYPYLKQVRPIAQAHATGDLRATLSSIEYYQRGCNLVMLLEQADTAAVPLHDGVVAISVLDDVGQRHWGILRAASGHSGRDGAILHVIAAFTPGFDPAAQFITAEMVLARSVSKSDDAAEWSAEGVLGGPWRFSFPLVPEAGETGEPATGHAAAPGSSLLRVIPVAQHR